MEESKIAVIGLGYVGLPLAVEFGKKIHTIGFDIDEFRVSSLKNFKDSTLEVDTDELKQEFLSYSFNLKDIRDCNIYIVAVPTPIDNFKQPDLTILTSVSRMIGSILKQGDLVIYESTVYPGATEEECVPILEKNSNLKFNEGFFCGYSPERINPGDKTHRLPDIKKVTSGSTPEIATIVDNLYKKIITAGTHKASSIKVAEAAKVIENTQRDVNIALINELSIIFNKLNIDTEEVLSAADTKWNFIPFRPGLVGGHCIGVDPYYLTHKAVSVGYTPEVILDTNKKYFSLKGVSYPENAQKFYGPIFDMAKNYIDKKKQKNEITMEVDFDYFNTSSARMLYQIFRLFNNAAESNDMGVNIVWKYESDDMDMIESGKDFDLMFENLQFLLEEKED